MLSSAQRKFLRAQAHNLKPVVITGAGGLHPGVLAEIDSSLAHHELIKVRLNAADRETRNALADKIVKYRNESGPFKSRTSIKKVPRLGPKAFEQAAGFLRIADAENPLDRSAVHPESYAVVKSMASDAGCSVDQLITDEKRRQKVELQKYVTEKVGIPTLQDIMAELAKPGRDPRAEYESFAFEESVLIYSIGCRRDED